MIPEERIGIGLTLVAVALGLGGAYLYQRFWVLSFVPVLLLIIVVIGFAIGKSIDAIKERELPARLRWRKAVAVPLMVGGFWTLDALTGLTSRASALGYLLANQDAMIAAQRDAGPGLAASIPYLQGVPDGGIRIIRHAGGDPADLSQAEHLRLTGERIQGCRRIGRRDWTCSYD
ncbi:hypothetical protein GGQ97_001480 [Sphingomonas kaistensis]|uniref:Uncharacterized protein n=1 Tax=Sphingomonas kaistensis TaxID=298708 RepID=A0A7X5Y6W6_9SPHN|nr:hypothetical protein [Sphingomonas kaistensis]NJC05687.1 hypothetical protein [Sphingomonas kaistensis]